MVEVFCQWPRDLGLIPGEVIPKTLGHPKLRLLTLLLLYNSLYVCVCILLPPAAVLVCNIRQQYLVLI